MKGNGQRHNRTKLHLHRAVVNPGPICAPPTTSRKKLILYTLASKRFDSGSDGWNLSCQKTALVETSYPKTGLLEQELYSRKKKNCGRACGEVSLDKGLAVKISSGHVYYTRSWGL